MKKFKSVIVIGSEGLIGKQVCRDLEINYHVIRSDILYDSGYDMTDNFLVDKLFNKYNIVGLANCSYPRGFSDHSNFFMEINEKFSHRFSLKENGGSIVNMASIYGILGPDDRIYKNTTIKMPSWYAAAKGAIISHSRCMATRYGKNNVRINCIAAGGVFDNHTNEFIINYCNRVPLNRMARPGDISSVIEFLISDKSSYITGQCISVDGGLSAW